MAKIAQNVVILRQFQPFYVKLT